MYTLDTNILIYFLKDESSIVEFLRENILKGSRFFISSTLLTRNLKDFKKIEEISIKFI